MHTHLAFIGQKYAMCGATVNGKNPATNAVAHANCPDCLEEIRVLEQANAALHSDRAAHWTRPTYEAE